MIDATNTQKEVFGKALRALRKAADWTQVELAGALKVSHPTIVNWEAGKFMPSPERLQEISTLFNVQPDFFMAMAPDDTEDDDLVSVIKVQFVALNEMEIDLVRAIRAGDNSAVLNLVAEML